MKYPVGGSLKRRNQWKTLLCLAPILFSCCYGLALAGDFQEDLKARRTKVLERLGPESILILWSAPSRTYSLDVDYEYHQDHNLYYLTGIDQEETILVLMPGNATRKEILFLKERNPVTEHWTGHLLSKEEATLQSGIETVYLTHEFETFIKAIFSRSPYDVPRYLPSQEYEPFFKAVSAGRAHLSLILSPRPGLSEPLAANNEFARKIQERYPGVTVQDASDIFRDLRQIKTPYERKVLERSVEISNQAHLAGMRAALPEAFEYQVKAAIEQVYQASGALGWGYPSIVGSGPNATILHYEKATRKMVTGDLLLVDAAANYGYLTGDITRTYPVSGRFSLLQKDLYQIVLAAQEEGIKVAKAGVRLSDIHQTTVAVVKQGLLRLGLITDASGDQYKTWYTHGACHFIGMDVHDVGDSDRPIEPGVAFVIEPGIYIREDGLTSLPKSPENGSFAEKVKPAFEKYKNLGIRIEDSFLLTESGLKRLSAGVPRTIEEIEVFMKSR
jgi:Xaa-Pro aminopeptidase